MAIDSGFTLTGRQLRDVWAEEHDELANESAYYAKRRLTLLDFLSNVSQSGHNVRVRTDSYDVHGTLVHLGNDFFSIATLHDLHLVHSFRLNSDENNAYCALEIDVTEKSQRASAVPLLRHDKSFASLLEDISLRDCHTEIETTQGNIYTGHFELLNNCVAINSSSSTPAMTLVTQNITIIPLKGIVSIVYTI